MGLTNQGSKSLSKHGWGTPLLSPFWSSLRNCGMNGAWWQNEVQSATDSWRGCLQNLVFKPQTVCEHLVPRKAFLVGSLKELWQQRCHPSYPGSVQCGAIGLIPWKIWHQQGMVYSLRFLRFPALMHSEPDAASISCVSSGVCKLRATNE